MVDCMMTTSIICDNLIIIIGIIQYFDVIFLLGAIYFTLLST